MPTACGLITISHSMDRRSLRHPRQRIMVIPIPMIGVTRNGIGNTGYVKMHGVGMRGVNMRGATVNCVKTHGVSGSGASVIGVGSDRSPPIVSPVVGNANCVGGPKLTV